MPSKFSNPSKTGRVRRRRECTSDNPQLRRTASAQQAAKGNIASIDELAGDIYIDPAAPSTVGSNGAVTTDRYKVRDGLLFNAVHPGDRVSFSFETVDGTKTITKLEKE